MVNIRWIVVEEERMKSRFDLEDAISACFATTDDIQLVADLMYDGLVNYSEDDLMTVLSGIAELHKARCTKLDNVFAQVFELNEYAKDRCNYCGYVNGHHHTNCALRFENSGMDGML